MGAYLVKERSLVGVSDPDLLCFLRAGATGEAELLPLSPATLAFNTERKCFRVSPGEKGARCTQGKGVMGEPYQGRECQHAKSF